MATKVKPSRIKVTGNPQAWQVPVYVDQDNFEWRDNWEVSWPASSTDWDIVLFDWATGKKLKDSWKKPSDYQEKLTAQTAYTAKGTSSKVPQITTNSLWQVTAITEVDISYPNQVSDTAYAASWDGVTDVAPSKNAVYDKIESVEWEISTINWLIPVAATTSNQLTDKNYVDDSINSVTAYYITKNANWDQFATYAELSAATTFYSGWVARVPTRNDYTIVLADENHDNATTRYIYNTTWEYQYTVNETALTQAQLDALNSWITANKVSTYDWYATSKQDTLTWQTAYTSKWTSTKVPTISTNSLWQVTSITETSITFPVTSVNWSTWDVTGLQTTANLKTDLTDNSDTYYPSQKAVKTAVDGKQDKATSWSWAPTSTPTFIWQEYIDTTNDKMYFATWTSSSSDWTLVGSWSWMWDVTWPASSTDWDIVLFDWASWKVIKDWSKKLSDLVQTSWNQTIAWTKTFSTSPVVPSKTTDATNTWTAIATEAQVYKKQDKLVSGTNIKSINNNSLLGSWNLTLNDVKVSSTAPSSPTEWMVWYDTTNDQLKVYDWTNWNVTGKEYNAGEWIEIKNWPDYSAMQWPAPDGFHVPLSSERWAIYNAWLSLWAWGSSYMDDFKNYLKLPFAGYRSRSSADVSGQGTYGYYWSSSRSSASDAYCISFYSWTLNRRHSLNRAYGYSVRCFKDVPTMPTSSWTKLYWTSIEAGWIFWSSTDWLISLSSDWQTWITIADKNLWATQVRNSWDTISESNCGKYYQRWNNYWFPRTWSVTTSSTQVDASAYWPWNYYSSNTFITYSWRWDSTDNWNLWWWVTWVVTLNNAITNTGVLSVNGQTGNVTTHSTTTCTLTSAGWSSNSQTVSVTGVTASNTVIVSPSPDDIADYADCGVYCSAQGSGTLTFGCDTAPSGDIVVNVLIMS